MPLRPVCGKNEALVAVSSGLLNSMTRDEAEAVMAHEVSHVANGDMVTLSLIQGIVNTFVIFLSRIVGGFVDRVVFKNERGYGIGYFISVMVAEIVFGILASIIVHVFSAGCVSFRADEGGARLAGKQKMIDALRRLQAQHEPETVYRISSPRSASTGDAAAACNDCFEVTRISARESRPCNDSSLPSGVGPPHQLTGMKLKDIETWVTVPPEGNRRIVLGHCSPHHG